MQTRRTKWPKYPVRPAELVRRMRAAGVPEREIESILGGGRK